MSEFKVSFYKMGKEKDEFLGIVFVDDNGTSDDFTLHAKAFRLAPSNCLLADKVISEKV